ncbi:hypothetical protein Hamer_G017312 [Homarus americanus]|uniref:Uncharacterized protein n=1 Tax=Homarus americanus TaxID=6706 RepID=A0A8J5K137_HOMAM|nr:hypothetical protein Hamer_G017312 [Homarus americanus]
MLSVRVAFVLLVSFASLATLTDALVFCPKFPSCCYPYDTCHALCPSCREARFFRNGIRKFPKYSRPCSIGGTFINPDPFLFPGSVPFPNPPICI